MRQIDPAEQPVLELLELRLLLDTGGPEDPLSDSHLSETDEGRVVLYVTVPSQKAGDTFVAGGVYRSSDRGETWEWAMGAGINMEIGQHPYGESDIDQYWFLDQADREPDIVYVTNRGTGYAPPYHYTVYRSSDAGVTWEDVFFNDPRFVESNTEDGWMTWEYSRGFGGQATTFYVNPNDSNQLLYNNYGELFQSTDAGVSWQQIFSHYADGQGPPVYREAGRWESVGLEVTTNWFYEFDPNDPDRAYICYTDIGFARSEDHGETWRHEFKGIDWPNTTYDIAFDPDVPGKIYGAFSNQHDIPHWTNIVGPTLPGGVAISTDYGDTWTSLHTGLPSAPVTSMVVDPTSPINARTLYAAVYGYGVYKSTDGGASWSQKSSGIAPVENRQSWQLRLTDDGTLFLTVAGRRAGNGVATNVTGGFYKSANGGDSWTNIGPPGMFRPVDFAIDHTDSDTIYVAAMDGLGHTGGGIWKTADGGASWTLLRPNFDTSILSWIEGFSIAINPINPDILYFTSVTHGMFISHNAGATWTEAGPGCSPPFRAIHRITWDPTDPGTVYVNTFGGGVWKGPDPAFGSGTWEAVGLGGGGAMFYGSASPLDPDLLFISCDMGGMYRSDTGGQSWSMLDWRDIEHSGWLVYHPTNPDVIYALPFQGNGWKVMKSTDRGLTWDVLLQNNALWTGQNVKSMVIDADNPQLMFIATNVAIYRSTNGGVNWGKMANSPANVIEMSIDQTSPFGNRVVFAVTTSAVWRSDDNGTTWSQKIDGLPAGFQIRDFSAGSDGVPYVRSSVINDGGASRSGITSLAFGFSEDVSGSLGLDDLKIIHDATGEPVDLSGLSPAALTWNPGLLAARWELPWDLLPAGSYMATLAAANITDTTGKRLDGNNNGLGGDDYSFAFFSLPGDVNGDGKADSVDLAYWQVGYDPIGAHVNTPEMGDVNHDGRIDSGDLAIWQQNYSPLGIPETGNWGPEAGMELQQALASGQPCDLTASPMTYYVATDGSNGGDGSSDHPWATISYALNHVQGGDTILVRDGVYNGGAGTYRSFSGWVTVKAEHDYGATVTNIVNDRGGTAFYVYTPGSAKLIVEGFVFTNHHPTYTSDVREGSALIHIQDAQDVIFRNNIIHGNNAPGCYNELFKVNRGGDPYYPKNIQITGNVFYDRPSAPGTDMIDSVRPGELIITDNIFFEIDSPNSQSFITIKREVLADTLGITPASPRHEISRNVFLNWSGSEGQAFIQLGEDADAQYMITDALIENNLLIGNSPDLIRAPFQLKGTKNVTVRANTIVGDLPGRAYGLRIGTEGDNPQVQDVFIYNNIWDDPTGTMGDIFSLHRFIETYGDVDVSSIELDSNLYWNDGRALPNVELPRPTDDIHRVVADPGLNTDYSTLVLPVWDEAVGTFLSGSTSIREEFVRLVTAYGAISWNSPAVDAADPANMPSDDILGNPRDASPDIGAFEFQWIPGDANGDRLVDSADLSVWQQNYDPIGSLSSTWQMGDWNADTRIDSGDLAIWQQNYEPLGMAAGAGFSTASAAQTRMAVSRELWINGPFDLAGGAAALVDGPVPAALARSRGLAGKSAESHATAMLLEAVGREAGPVRQPAGGAYPALRSALSRVSDIDRDNYVLDVLAAVSLLELSAL